MRRDSWPMGICEAFARRRIRSLLICCCAFILYNKGAKKNNEQIKGIALRKKTDLIRKFIWEVNWFCSFDGMKYSVVKSPRLVGVPGVTGRLGMAAVLLGAELASVAAAQHSLTGLEQRRPARVLVRVLVVYCPPCSLILGVTAEFGSSGVAAGAQRGAGAECPPAPRHL